MEMFTRMQNYSQRHQTNTKTKPIQTPENRAPKYLLAGNIHLHFCAKIPQTPTTKINTFA